MQRSPYGTNLDPLHKLYSLVYLSTPRSGVGSAPDALEDFWKLIPHNGLPYQALILGKEHRPAQFVMPGFVNTHGKTFPF